MVLTSNLGYPRIGPKRELKFALENYWSGQSDIGSLLSVSESIQINNWRLQKSLGIDRIPSNDFSLYDHVLDTAVMVTAIPARFQTEDLDDEYIALFCDGQGISEWHCQYSGYGNDQVVQHKLSLYCSRDLPRFNF